jgi:hypothetical protein
VLKVPSLTIPAKKQESLHHSKTQIDVNSSKPFVSNYNSTGKYFKSLDQSFRRKNKLHKNSEHSIASERILPTKFIDKTSSVKPSYMNLIHRHRSSSFDESGRFDCNNCDENSELQLHDETQFNINSDYKEEELEYGYSDQNIIMDNLSVSNGLVLASQPKVERDLIQVFGDSILSV